MDFLFTINDKYIEPIKALIYSIYINNGGQQRFYFIYRDLDAKSICDITEFCRDKCCSDALFYEFNLEINELKLIGTWSIEIYYRLFAPYILSHLDRILYLDGDTIVSRNLSILENVSLDGYDFAAVLNDVQKTHIERLGLPKGSKYYNSGVLLINLKSLRNSKTKQQVLKDLKNNRERYLFPDQDYINANYQGRVFDLGKEFNYMISLTEKVKYYSKIKKPYIIHYVLTKPWLDYFEYLTDGYYLKYLYLAGQRKKALHLLYMHRRLRIKKTIKSILSISNRNNS